MRSPKPAPGTGRPRAAGPRPRAPEAARARPAVPARRARGAIPGRWRRGDRGVTVVELAFIMPVVLAIILLIIQFALWFHGRQVADAAAREGARVARSMASGQGWDAQAEERAESVARAIGPKLLENAQADAWEEGNSRGVTVTGDAVAVVPLFGELNIQITATFGGPVECFRPDVGEGVACEAP
ncbi:TadE family protein [Bailinhaonella thermotolerans]|uniref:Pilus assembly protein n=1 Tax=Bailinhaonella thermotolerans TaxID=1070861 RepID=A0A3A4B7T7_9ACTN|nr:TadE/TadG family type IV pilus assembly protein [Bailinhaonella thermotolerans]RJL33554.1 pilus assembly protein [Bailinhaonella thermotolerans]